MADLLVCKEKLLAVVALYRKKYELSKEVGEDYYEPGMMENLGQYRGNYNEGTGQIEICCESKGMRYENRTMNDCSVTKFLLLWIRWLIVCVIPYAHYPTMLFPALLDAIG